MFASTASAIHGATILSLLELKGKGKKKDKKKNKKEKKGKKKH